MLGPSGSGKTTCLRMIAGFETPTAGRILLDGEDVSRLAPYERDVNTVFQDYALFPHMTVAEQRRVRPQGQAGSPKDERRDRVNEALAMVQLSEFGERKPAQLSGGQRQRVALARALVNRPQVLLLDEPLGALDLKLRQAMQIELKEIQQAVGLTFIYVTHDQEEALTMSDRIAVFNHGRIEQVGTPAEVYERPATGFVAGFVGVSNVLEGEPAQADHRATDTRSRSGPEKIVDARAGRARWDRTTARQPDTSARSYTWVRSPGTSCELDVGGELVVMQQNLTTSSMEALQVRGQGRAPGVGAEEQPLGRGGRGALEGSMDQEEGAR